MKRTLRHASLFSGIGGPEVAAAMLGWENVFHCEINPFGRQVLDYWFPESDSYEDITKTDFRKYRGRVDVLTGGFPCQPFSCAGKRKGADDDRYLWPEMLRVIDEVRPSWVIGENVAGITSMVEPGEIADLGCEGALFGEGDGVHRYVHRGGFTVERVCSDLERAGYSVQPVLIPACSVGAPHRRDRVFFIAHANGDGGQEETEREPRKVKKGDEQSEPLFSSIVSEAPNSNGCKGEPCRRESESEVGEQRVLGSGNTKWMGGKKRADAYTHDTGVESQRQRREDEIYADSYGKRLSAVSVRDGNVEKKRKDEKRCAVQYPRDDWRASLADRWHDFPTVSPVCRRDDGLPFDVDDLAISYTRWRTESLKAYGNAIVPQVIYEIFRAIEAAD